MLVSEDNLLHQNGISRRDSIKRGAAVGGAVLWSAPVIRAVNLAQGEPRSPVGHAISYIAMNVVCNGATHVIKWEVDENAWDPDPGSFPFCGGVFSPNGQKANGGTLGFVASSPNGSGCITVTVPSGCQVTSSASMGGTICCGGPAGTGNLVFCPCPPA